MVLSSALKGSKANLTTSRKEEYVDNVMLDRIYTDAIPIFFGYETVVAYYRLRPDFSS
jgi:hypothetical protein